MAMQVVLSVFDARMTRLDKFSIEIDSGSSNGESPLQRLLLRLSSKRAMQKLYVQVSVVCHAAEVAGGFREAAELHFQNHRYDVSKAGNTFVREVRYGAQMRLMLTSTEESRRRFAQGNVTSDAGGPSSRGHVGVCTPGRTAC